MTYAARTPKNGYLVQTASLSKTYFLPSVGRALTAEERVTLQAAAREKWGLAFPNVRPAYGSEVDTYPTIAVKF